MSIEDLEAANDTGFCHQTDQFKYFQIRLTKIHDSVKGAQFTSKRYETITKGEDVKFVIQIVDFSGKILYDEAAAKQSFVTMMQATASHELRTPLSCLINRLEKLQEFIVKVEHAS